MPGAVGPPMLFASTRGAAPPVRLSEALLAGLAPDGGLYVPHSVPRLSLDAFDPADDLATTAARLLAPFAAGDPLADALPAITREAFTFDAPLKPMAGDDASVLELFHGPTAAFKDFGARFLARAMAFSGWVATVAGWYVAEIGRQPWLVHGVLRTADAVGEVAAPLVAGSLALYLALYVALLAAYVATVFRLAAKAGEPASASPGAVATTPGAPSHA